MVKTQSPPGPGRPKDLQKRAAILDSAKNLFGERGYGGTSMDAVAGQAGVSKLTVYSHFGDKAALFRAAVRARCSELFPDNLYLADEYDNVEQALRTIALHHARLSTSRDSIGIYRAVSGGRSDKRRQLGRLIWEEGPNRVHELIRGFLQRQQCEGRLDIDDCDVAATQFMALLKGDLHLRRMLCCDGIDEAVFERQVEANAAAAVTMFLRAYQPRS